MTIPIDVHRNMPVYHRQYNLSHKDNLSEIPEQGGVFGLFAIVEDEPANCRFIGSAKSIQDEIRNLFENPPNSGLKKFLHGPWISMLVYQLMTDNSEDQINATLHDWRKKFKPGIEDNGDYPGYYDR